MVRAAAETLRANPAFDTEQAITELAIGEALVSVLDARGSPTITERAWILPPASRIGPLTDAERNAIRSASVSSYGHYEKAVDRESAYERLMARTEARTPGEAPAAPEARPEHTVLRPKSAPAPQSSALNDLIFGRTGPRGGQHDGLVQAVAKSAARSIGSGFGRAILRGALGSILGGKR
jgi:DNA helicase HerA-like ATPase